MDTRKQKLRDQNHTWRGQGIVWVSAKASRFDTTQVNHAYIIAYYWRLAVLQVSVSFSNYVGPAELHAVVF